MTRVFVLSALVLLALLVPGCVSTGYEFPVATSEPPGIELRVTPTFFYAGDHENELRLTLINRSNDPIVAVTPGDGSEVGWRTPIVRIEAKIEKTKKVVSQAPLDGRCGNLNAIGADEVFTLHPGDEIELSGEWINPWHRLPAGRYSVTFEYEHDPTLERTPFLVLGEDDREAVQTIRESRPYLCRSRPIIVIVPPRK